MVGRLRRARSGGGEMPRSTMMVGSASTSAIEATEDGGDTRLEFSDVGKLLRRTQRRIVWAAREQDRETLPKLIREHLRTARSSVDVVEETWPSYEHVNVQVGLDAWLARPGR